MASSTRVEKLQYKEIPTPSWRVNDVAEVDDVKVEVGILLFINDYFVRLHQ